jgi:GxxExxY protein
MNRRDVEGAEAEKLDPTRASGTMQAMCPARPSKPEPSPELNELTEAVIGAAIEVHRHLGPGYLESVYEGALTVELSLRGIPFERQLAIPVCYKGCSVGEGRVDFLVGKVLIVELKASEALVPIHRAQVISYLKALGLSLGLLINFNVPTLRAGIRRVIRSG